MIIPRTTLPPPSAVPVHPNAHEWSYFSSKPLFLCDINMVICLIVLIVLGEPQHFVNFMNLAI